jgi:hypothetical protein
VTKLNANSTCQWEVDMFRTVFAGIIGAIGAIAVIFLVAAVLGAVGGETVMYEDHAIPPGWEGAQNGMAMLLFIGMEMVWVFPAVALAGAAAGIIVRQVIRKRAAFEPSATDRH